MSNLERVSALNNQIKALKPAKVSKQMERMELSNHLKEEKLRPKIRKHNPKSLRDLRTG
jgi:nucleosome binding factor SPN SPT16 subunit